MLLGDLLGENLPRVAVRQRRVVVRVDLGLLRGLHLLQQGVPLVDLRYQRDVVRVDLGLLRGVPLRERHVPGLPGRRRRVLGGLDVLLGELLGRHLPLIGVRGQRVVVHGDFRLLRGLHLHLRRLPLTPTGASRPSSTA